MNFMSNSSQGSSSGPQFPERQPSFDPQDDDSSLLGSFLGFVWETVKVVVISLIIIIPVRYFLVQPFFVNGASMDPTLFDHEYLIIDEISYRFEEPKRGDIVVFRYPRDPGQFFIKRIVGLPGETVTIGQGIVSIINDDQPNGYVLDESFYLSEDVETRGDVSRTLGDHEYYVLGDHRKASLDSRTFGPVEREALVGKAWLRGWPIDRATVFPDVIY